VHLLAFLEAYEWITLHPIKESILWSRWAAAFYFQQRRKGSPHHAAVRALALKWQRVLCHLLKYKQAFNPEVFAKEEARMQRKKLTRLQNLAATMNYQLVPTQ
jgi:hypothetical protein